MSRWGWSGDARSAFLEGRTINLDLQRCVDLWTQAEQFQVSKAAGMRDVHVQGW